MDSNTKPHILVADDDPVSLQFLAIALRELDCEITAVANGTAVLATCANRRFDLLLLDRRMPDLGGAALLRILREHGDDTPAIATSAELDNLVRDELRTAGYVDAISKPVGIEQLARAISGCVAKKREQETSFAAKKTASSPSSNPLDDGVALDSVGGDANALRALRGLLAQELKTTIAQIDSPAAAMSTQELSEYLHRLRASCRYCGAVSLGDAAEQLEAKLRSGGANSDSDLRRFLSVCAETVAALSEPIA